MGIAAEGQLLFSWGRYLYWADLMRRNWEKFMTERGEDANKAVPEWLGVSCYWAASLFVVIEGWETAQFSDPIIDALLGLSNYKDVLKRLRNGTFHYQPEIISPKVMEFFKSPEVALWLYFLHEEFCRWLRDWVETVEVSAPFLPAESEEWRTNFSTLVGWLPPRLAEAELKEARRRLHEYGKEYDTSRGSSDGLQELGTSQVLYDMVVKKAAEGVRDYRRAQLTKLGLNPNDFIP
jgi:hypothetical protein